MRLKKESKIRVRLFLFVILIFNLCVNSVFAAKNYDSLDRYYKIEIKFGDYEIALEQKWISALKKDSESAKIKSETGKEANYIVDINMYNSYKREKEMLHQKGKTIKLLAERGVDCSESLISYENDIETFKTKWNNYIDGEKSQDSVNNKKKKSIGHANVGAKIWQAGEDINSLFEQEGINPIENQIQNNTIITDDNVYFDLGNMGTIQGPKVLELDNGKIEIINAKTGMNVDEDGSYPFIELQYRATIYDSKKESLKFHLNNTEINVSIYDEITTYTFSDRGNYYISK